MVKISILLSIFISQLGMNYAINNRPIIGVISQELIPNSSYIAASYVKWLEAAGARVVPIIVNTETEPTEDDLEYYHTLFQGISGLLIPGGIVDIYDSGYARASKIFFDLAIEENLKGGHFPIWATCLGFEMITLMAANGQPSLESCDAEQALPLTLTEEYGQSRMFGQAPSDIISHLTTLNTTANSHSWCLSRENFTRFEMEEFWQLLSVNEDANGLEFISALEARDFPFFTTIFHPEKNLFEWTEMFSEIPHTREAVSVALYFAQFFVDQARMSPHSFPSRTEEESFLIYNHQTTYTGIQGDFPFEEIYVF